MGAMRRTVAVPACTSESIDSLTELITVPAESPAVAGDLDRSLSKAILSGARTVVVDVSALEALDPALISVLTRGQDRIGWRNGRIALVCGPSGRRRFADSGMDRAFDVYATRGDIGTGAQL